MKEPSEKQVSFARSISFVTKVPLPEEETAQAQIKRWSDPAEHEKARIRQQKACGKKVICIETGIIYNCIGDANEALGKSRQATGISMCLSGTRQTAHGYHWKRVEENE